jgi:glucose 1-dehydrogenase
MRYMEKILQGKIALVTGGSSGIGKAIAIALGENGANVVVNYHSDEEGAREAKQKIELSGAKAIIVQADVSKEDDVTRLFEESNKAFGSIDIVVSNAGIQKDSEFSEMTLRDWQRVIDVNLGGYFLCSRQAVNEFLKKPSGTTVKAIGNIIFVSSVHDVIPWAGHANYAASKGGVSMLMKSLALEVAPQKIRVNAISPGAIKTDINKEAWSDPAKEKELLKLIPYQRVGEVEDVAEVAVWLASGKSDYITGATIYVDGGMTLYPGFVNNG